MKIIMKKNNVILTSIFTIAFLISGINVYSQNSNCKVKMESISGTYSGKCKKGLAHGKGVAEGTDHYSGWFSKGLPHGEGKYIWANGDWYEGAWKYGIKEGEGKLVSGGSVISGYWKEDRYIGEKLIQSYTITRSLHVVRYSFRKIKTPNHEVKIKLTRGGVENAGVEDFMIAYTSGEQFKLGGYTGLQNPRFPLDVKVTFNAWNLFRTAKSEVVFEFTINEPGNWDIIISY